MAREQTRCKAADNYNGFRRPSCGCDACIDIYVRTKVEQIMHNDLHDDPMLVRHVAGSIIEVLGTRKP